MREENVFVSQTQSEAFSYVWIGTLKLSLHFVLKNTQTKKNGAEKGNV